MSKTITNDTRCCATCANWAGPRTPLHGGSYVEVSSSDVRGKCYANVFCGVTSGPTATDGRSCSKYTKWGAMR